MKFYRDTMGEWTLVVWKLRFLFIGDRRDWFPLTSWSLRPMLWIDLGFVLITDRDTYKLEDLEAAGWV